MKRPLTFAVFPFTLAALFLGSHLIFDACVHAAPQLPLGTAMQQHPTIVVKHLAPASNEALTSSTPAAPNAPVTTAPAAKEPGRESHIATRDEYRNNVLEHTDAAKRSELCRRLEHRRQELRQQARQRNK